MKRFITLTVIQEVNDKSERFPDKYTVQKTVEYANSTPYESLQFSTFQEALQAFINRLP